MGIMLLILRPPELKDFVRKGRQTLHLVSDVSGGVSITFLSRNVEAFFSTLSLFSIMTCRDDFRRTSRHCTECTQGHSTEGFFFPRQSAAISTLLVELLHRHTWRFNSSRYKLSRGIQNLPGDQNNNIFSDTKRADPQ